MTVLVNVRVTPQERDEWKSRAQSQGVSLSDLIRFAVNAPVAPAQPVSTGSFDSQGGVSTRLSPVQRKFAPDFKSISPPKKRKF